jgi:hypothetical protein
MYSQYVFLVLNFSNLAILVGKKKIFYKFKKKYFLKKCQKFEITNFKEKRLFLMIKILKIILIIPTLNT